MTPKRAERRYTSSSAVPREAREFVDDVLTSADKDEETKETVDVLTSEIVSDAMRHGSGDLSLRVDVADDVVRVEVDDEPAVVPDGASDRLERRIGRRLVDRLSRRWGSEGGRHRTTTWFEVDSSDADSPDGSS